MARAVIFSGGTAFRDTARELARRQCDITYLITTFDSGGSSQALRRAFAMPAVGDLRNRLLAIAQDDAAAQALNVRLDANEDKAREELRKINISQRLSAVAEPVRSAIASDLERVIAALPEGFQASRASIGNLAITGAWLANGHDLLAAVQRYGELLRCVGRVLPICDRNLHLAARLKNGQVIGQQHLFRHMSAPVKELFLTDDTGAITSPEAEPEALGAIDEADLVIYPMGSFYSSILANFLSRGVARVLSQSPVNKIFIPNVGTDAESRDLSIVQQARTIINTLGRQVGRQDNLLHGVLVDLTTRYPDSLSALSVELGAMDIRLLPAAIAPGGISHEPALLAFVIEALLDCA